jgi:hypothetical protein
MARFIGDEVLQKYIDPVATDNLPRPLTPYEEFAVGMDAKMAALNLEAKKNKEKHPDYTNFVRSVLMKEGAKPGEQILTRPIK